MTEWAKEKSRLFGSDTEQSESDSSEDNQFSTAAQNPWGIIRLAPTDPEMGKTVSYEIFGKACLGSTYTFSGQCEVPHGTPFATIHAKLTAYWGGNNAGIRALHNTKEVVDSWNTLADAVKENLLSKEGMLPACWTRLQQKQSFSIQEVKSILDEFRPKKTITEEAAKQGKSSNEAAKSGKSTKEAARPGKSPKEAAEPGQSSSSGLNANTEKVTVETQEHAVRDDDLSLGASESVVTEETGAKSGGVSLESSETDDILVWQFYEADGRPGRQFAFDGATQQEIKRIFSTNPQMRTSQFFIECGVKLLPLLQADNALLTGKVEDLSEEVMQLRAELAKVSSHRDSLVNDAMSRGSLEVGEVSKAKMEAGAAKAEVENLRVLITSLQEQAQTQGDLKLVMEKLDFLKLSSTKTAQEVEKTALNTEKIVQRMGEIGVQERKALKLFTPAAKKLNGMENEWFIVAPESFFSVTAEYRSLGNDINKMDKSGKLVKMDLAGQGKQFANDFIKRRPLQDSWDGKVVVLIIDGAEGLQDKEDMAKEVVEDELESVGKFLTIPFQNTKPKKIFIVVGPTMDDDTETSRKVITTRMTKSLPDSTVLDMSLVAKKVGEGTLEKWCRGVEWSPLGAANLLTRLAWWAEGAGSRSAEENPADSCVECGFAHEPKSCLKMELPENREAKQPRSEDVSRNNRNEDGPRNNRSEDVNRNNRSEDVNRNNRNKNSFRQPSWPDCATCGKPHRPPCAYLNADNSSSNNRKRTGGNDTYKGGPPASKMFKPI